MLNEILVWWWQQMRSLLGGRWLDRPDDRAGALLVEAEGEDAGQDTTYVRLRYRRRGREEALGRFVLNAAGLAAIRPLLARLRPRRCILMLPPDQLLERTVSLPLAAERDWPRIMGFEMDRLTPFAANEVFWGGEVSRRDRVAGRIELVLSLVPRAPLDQLLGALSQAGLRPHVLQSQAPGGPTREIALERSHSGRAVWERRAQIAAWAVCAVLAAIALALPVVQQQLALHAAEQRIAALRADVAQAEAVRRALIARVAGSDAVAARQLQSSDPLAVLAAVTDALPDDTYLNELTMEHDHLSMSGQSAAAARLISALAASPRLRNPVFSAPVTRNEAGHVDLFSIRAETTP
jgi:general secretion pathway protein L